MEKATSVAVMRGMAVRPRIRPGPKKMIIS